jgi:D-sedoheptulose 7-phosphate isomerase
VNAPACSPVEELLKRLPELESCRDSIDSAFRRLVDTFDRGGKLLLCGNGGSAADCEHIVGELMKGFNLPRRIPESVRAEMIARNPQLDISVLDKLQCGLPAVSLTGAMSLNTAYQNDVDPALVYAQQLFVLGRAGDLLLGISTSGSAGNVCAAMQVARACGICTVALTGENGGQMSELADVCIRVPARETFRVQEYHLPVYHALCAALEIRYFGRPDAC